MGFANGTISAILVDFIVWISPLVAAILKVAPTQYFAVTRVLLDEGDGIVCPSATDTPNPNNTNTVLNDTYTYGFFSVILYGLLLTVLRIINLLRVKGKQNDQDEADCGKDCCAGFLYYCKVNLFCGDRLEEKQENNQLYYLLMVGVLSPAQTIAIFAKPCNNASFFVFVALLATSLELLASSEPILAAMLAYLKKYDDAKKCWRYSRCIFTILTVLLAFVTQFVNLAKIAAESGADAAFWTAYGVYGIFFAVVLIPSVLFSFCHSWENAAENWKKFGSTCCDSLKCVGEWFSLVGRIIIWVCCKCVLCPKGKCSCCPIKCCECCEEKPGGVDTTELEV